MPDELTLTTYEDWLGFWKTLHVNTWRKYAGEANEKILLEGAQNFRPCQTAFDRSFHQNKNSFIRTDGKTPEDDTRELAERKSAEAAELERTIFVSHADIEYAASLSPAQLVEAYKDPTFAMKYRVLMREHGFRPVPTFSSRPGVR